MSAAAPASGPTPARQRRRAESRLIAGFAIAVFLVAVMGCIATISLSRAAATTARVSHAQDVRERLGRTMLAITEMESDLRGFRLTHDPRFLAPYSASRAAARAELRRVRELTADNPRQQRALGALEPLVRTRIDILDDGVRRVGAGEPAAPGRLLDGGDVMDTVRATVARMEDEETRLLVLRIDAAADQRRDTRIAMLLGFLLAFAFGVLSVLRIVADIGERRRRSSELRRLLHEQSLIREAVGDGLYGIDMEGRTTFANPAAECMLGWDESELLGRDEHALLHHSRPDGARYAREGCPVHATLRDGATRHCSTDVFWRKDGTAFPVEFVSTALRDGNRVVGAVVVFRDITARRAHEAALLAARDSAEAASRAKSEFLARMSHELRTPLNAVIGFSGVLRKNRRGTLSDGDLGYVERIAANGRHLLSIINDILDLAKIEAGRTDLAIAPLDPAQLVEEVVASVAPGVSAGAVTLDVVVPRPVAPLRADPVRLRQVLMNLVGNALKFTASGSVTVRVVVDPRTRAAQRIDVADSGIGIPAERQAAVFEAFEQAEAGTSRRYGGTGLGLPIARSLCELMGFRLTLVSEMGVGSVFSVLLDPAAQAPSTVRGHALPEPAPPAAHPVPLRDAAGAGASGHRVLVIDDDGDARALLTRHIEDVVAEVRSAPTGETGLAIARSWCPDLITLDLMMPGMDGWEVLRRLQADPLLAGIPVVVVSMVATDNRGSLCGAVELVDRHRVTDSIGTVLGRHLPVPAGRVLVVDDAPDARALVMLELRELGALDIVEAADGQAALALAEAAPPSLIVLDLAMPGMDGWALLGELRSRPSLASVPVVVLSACDLTAQQGRLLAAETIAVLRKGDDVAPALRRAALRALTPRRAAAGAAYHARAAGMRPGRCTGARPQRTAERSACRDTTSSRSSGTRREPRAPAT